MKLTSVITLRATQATGSSLRWAKKLIYSTCIAATTLFVAMDAHAQTMVQRWANLNVGATLNSEIAYSTRSGAAHIYLILDGTTSGKISISKASDGLTNGLTPQTLKFPTAAMSLGTGIPGGTYYIRGLCNDADGYVYGCNYIAAAGPQYILQWDPANENANPTVIWSGTVAGTAGTLGHNLAVYGTGNNRVFVISSTAATTSGGGLIVYFNGTSWVAKAWKFGASGPIATAVQSGLSFIDHDTGTGIYRFYSKFSNTGAGAGGYINSFKTSDTSPVPLTMTLAGGTTAEDPLAPALSGAISLSYDPFTGLIALATRPNGTFGYTNILATTYGGDGTNILGPHYLDQKTGTTTGSDGGNPGGACWGGGAMFTAISVNAGGNGIMFCHDITAFKLASGSDPVDSSKNFGQNATFTVASGGSSLTYHWKKDGVNISNGGKYSGATTATLTITGVDASDARLSSLDGSTGYSCAVSGVSASTWTSAGAALTVTDPIISVNPVNTTAPINGGAVFTVTASGSATLQYQWRIGGVNLVDGDQGDGTTVAGATTSSLTFSAVTFAFNATTYDCVVTSTAGGTGTATSTAATLSVNDPAITTDTTPASRSVSTGDTTTFSIVAAGSGVLTYQWYQNPGDVLLSNSGDFSGVDTATLQISPVAKVDAASYYCVVTESGGPNSPQTSTPASLTVLDPPAVIAQPSGETVTKGDNATFSITATGDSISYIWKKDGVALANGAQGSGSVVSGATTASLLITGVHSGDVGAYTAVVSNGVGPNVTSDPANLAIQYTVTVAMTGNTGDNAAATITKDPDQAVYAPGSVVTVTATAVGANYSLDSWSGTGVGSTTTIPGRGALTTNVLAITVNDNIGETASFTLPNIIVDNSDTNGTEALGTFSATPDNTATYWTHGSSTIPFFPLDYQFAVPTGSEGAPTVVATFTPNIQVSGNYDVYVSYNNGANRASDAPYRIKTAGNTNTVRVNQTVTLLGQAGALTNQSVFGKLSTPSKYFFAGTSGAIELGNDCSNAAVIADAVWLVWSATQDTPVTLASPATNLTINSGDNAVFSVAIDPGATAPITYNWLKDGTNVSGPEYSGADTDTLTITGALLANAGTYTCVISNVASTVFSSATLSVGQPPTVDISDIVTGSGADVVFAAVIGGDSATYSWTKDSNPLSDGGNISGATTANLSISNAQLSDGGIYEVTAVNASGTASDSATLTVIDPPSITTGPSSINSVNQGGSQTFTVTATGGGLSYQWYHGVSLLSGSTDSSLTVSNIQSADIVDGWTVVVSNPGGSVTSSPPAMILGLLLDLNAPSVAVTTPGKKKGTNAIAITITGVAKDTGSGIIRDVKYVLNNGAETSVTTLSLIKPGQWSFASAAETLIPGTNTVSVWALDLANNASVTNIIEFYYDTTNTLTLNITGNGNVKMGTSLFNGPTTNIVGVFKVGRSYKLDAYVNKGTNYIFTNWVTAPVDMGKTTNNWTQKSSLVFVMQSNMVINANFNTNVFTPIVGSYNGLFSEISGITHETAGYIQVKVKDKSTYSGYLLFDGVKRPFSGKFKTDGTVTKEVDRSKPPTQPNVTMSLTLDLNGEIVNGTVAATNGDWTSQVIADKAIYSDANPETHNVGNYTLQIPAGLGSPTSSPGGTGYSTVTNSPKGIAKFGGLLSDNQKISASLPLSRDGHVPVYVGLYKNATVKDFRGSLMGWLTFTNATFDTNNSLALTWIKKETTDVTAQYAAGFSNTIDIAGAPYLAPAPGVAPLDVGYQVILSDGNLAAPVTNLVTAVAATATGTKVTLSSTTTEGALNKAGITFNAKNGTFSVGFLYNPPNTPATKALGVVLQLQNTTNVSGYFLQTGATQSGSVTVKAP